MKKFNNELFQELQKLETLLHEKFGFSKDVQLMFEPLYKLCRPNEN